MEHQQSESIIVKIFGKDYSFKATGIKTIYDKQLLKLTKK